MTKRKKDFPIKYMRKGLFSDEDFEEREIKKKGKRRVKKPKQSVHTKTGIGRNKWKMIPYNDHILFGHLTFSKYARCGRNIITHGKY